MIAGKVGPRRTSRGHFTKMRITRQTKGTPFPPPAGRSVPIINNTCLHVLHPSRLGRRLRVRLWVKARRRR